MLARPYPSNYPLYTLAQIKDVLCEENTLIDFGIDTNLKPVIYFETSETKNGHYPICKEVFDVLETVSEERPIKLYIKSNVLAILHRNYFDIYETFLSGIKYLETSYIAITIYESNPNRFAALNEMIYNLSSVCNRGLFINPYPGCIYPESTKNAMIEFILRSKTTQIESSVLSGEGTPLHHFLVALREAANTPMCDRNIPLESTTKSASKR